VGDPKQYRTLHGDAGFNSVKIVDATYECWIQASRHALQLLQTRFLRKEIGRQAFERRRVGLLRKAEATRYYLLVSACKANLR